MQMKIGIIGSAVVVETLVNAFLKEGYELMLGTRDQTKDTIKKWKAENPSEQTGSFSDAAAFGELLVLATAGRAAV